MPRDQACGMCTILIALRILHGGLSYSGSNMVGNHSTPSISPIDLEQNQHKVLRTYLKIYFICSILFLIVLYIYIIVFICSILFLIILRIYIIIS